VDVQRGGVKFQRRKSTENSEESEHRKSGEKNMDGGSLGVGVKEKMESPESRPDRKRGWLGWTFSNRGN